MAALNSDEIDMPVMDLADGNDSEQDGDESDGEIPTKTKFSEIQKRSTKLTESQKMSTKSNRMI